MMPLSRSSPLLQTVTGFLAIKKVVLACLILDFFFFVLIVPIRVVAAESELQLKIMDYNTELADPEIGIASCDEYERLRNYSIAKINRLADLIISNQIDVAFFQEMQIRCMKFNETEKLAELLAQKGYPMYFTYKEYVEGQTQWFHVSTFSKYPFETAKIVHLPMQDGSPNKDTRWLTKAQIILPDGQIITTYNFHTRASSACYHVEYFLKTVNADPYPLILLAADFNHFMKRDACGGSVADYVLNTTMVVLPPKPPLMNKPIDYIMIKRNDAWRFVSSRYQLHTGNPIDHPSVYAVVNLKTTPTPTPPVAPTGLTARCAIDGTAATAVFTWNTAANTTKYMLRLNKQNSCTNTAGQQVPWYCPEPDATGKEGDQILFMAHTSCPNGTCTLTTPVVPNAPYLDWSVQSLDSAGNPAPTDSRTDTTGFTCSIARKGDFNHDGVINQQDLTLLTTALSTTNCTYNLTPSSPPTNDCFITIQDFNTLVGLVRG